MSKVVNVAIAVIYYEKEFLLGYRFAQQHQGNKYEFVGGKIEASETAQQAIIREIKEEIDISIDQNNIRFLGEVSHNYPKKSVCLQVYLTEVNKQQYDFLASKKTGNLNQPIIWVDKTDLLNNKYELPDANNIILEWLKEH